MEKVLSKDGTEIAFDKSGQGFPVILVHGAMIYRKFVQAEKIAELLSSDFTVINYDRRGRGDSGDTKPYSPEREVEDLEALLNYVGGKAYVFGLSSGAALAVLATANGLPIQKLVLYEPPYVAKNEDEKKAAVSLVKELQTLVAENRRAEAFKAFLKKVGVPAPIRWIAPLTSFWKSGLKIAHTLPYDFAILGDQSVPTQNLAKIKIPALVMNGEKSPASLKTATEATARAMPNSTYVVLPKQSHQVSPTVLVAAMIPFLKNQS